MENVELEDKIKELADIGKEVTIEEIRIKYKSEEVKCSLDYVCGYEEGLKNGYEDLNNELYYEYVKEDEKKGFNAGFISGKKYREDVDRVV